MTETHTRRQFIAGSAAAVGTSLALFGLDEGARAAGPVDPAADTVSASYPSTDPDLVREVVGASHARFDRVKELVTARPELAKASYDWGFGDWESAIGAASHVGRRDIVELLLEYGARPTLFTHVMLGHLDVVRATIEASPGIQRAPGPHGITLLKHARNRLQHPDVSDTERVEVGRVIEYLEKLGDADQGPKSLEISAAEKAVYEGTYRFGPGDSDIFVVEVNRRGALMMQRGTLVARGLHRVETHAFTPAGAPSVRIRFDVDAEGKSAIRLSIHDPEPILVATRAKTQKS